LENNKELYLKIAKDTQPTLNKMLSEIRTEIIKILGSNRIGVFGPYKDSIQGITVKDIIDDLAKIFIKEGFTVITGIGIYMPSADITHLFNRFFKLITTLEPKIAFKDLYKYLVTFAPNAVFILTSSRSSSLFEEESFYDNDYLDNEQGVGFLIYENEQFECSYLRRFEFDQINCWLCEGKSPSHCEKNEGNCTFFQQGVNYSTINMFVISEYMKLVVTHDYHYIPAIMMYIIENF